MSYLSTEEEKRAEHQKIKQLEKLSGEGKEEEVQVAFYDLHPKTQTLLKAGMKICDMKLGDEETSKRFKELIKAEEEITRELTSEDFEQLKVFYTPETHHLPLMKRYWWKIEVEGHEVEDLFLLEPEVSRIKEDSYFEKIFKVSKGLEMLVEIGLAEDLKSLAVSTAKEEESKEKENPVKKDPTVDVQKLLLSGCFGELKKVPEDEDDWVNDEDFDFIEISFTHDNDTKKIKALLAREESLDDDEMMQRIFFYRKHHLWLMMQLGIDEDILQKYEDLANDMYASEDDVSSGEYEDSSEDEEEEKREEKKINN